MHGLCPAGRAGCPPPGGCGGLCGDHRRQKIRSGHRRGERFRHHRGRDWSAYIPAGADGGDGGGLRDAGTDGKTAGFLSGEGDFLRPALRHENLSRHGAGAGCHRHHRHGIGASPASAGTENAAPCKPGSRPGDGFTAAQHLSQGEHQLGSGDGGDLLPGRYERGRSFRRAGDHHH